MCVKSKMCRGIAVQWTAECFLIGTSVIKLFFKTSGQDGLVIARYCLAVPCRAVSGAFPTSVQGIAQGLPGGIR